MSYHCYKILFLNCKSMFYIYVDFLAIHFLQAHIEYYCNTIPVIPLYNSDY